jgi:hypothetical protein
MSDEQDRAEALDDDKLDTDYPPEEPQGVDEPEVTAEGEWAQESFEERSARLAGPDDDDDGDRSAIHPYVDPSQDVLDDEAQAVAEADPAGREEYELAADRVPEPAEEAALHIEPDA